MIIVDLFGRSWMLRWVINCKPCRNMFVSLTQNINSLFLYNNKQKSPKIPVPNKKLTHEYWNNRNSLMSLNEPDTLLARVPGFCSLTNFYYLIFIGDFLRLYKSSDAVTYAKHPHSEWLYNMHIRKSLKNPRFQWEVNKWILKQ